ncbi:MAG: YicC family protein [Acidobacteria bacterium 13_1_20CM_2_55_15]|nr:MAG: YicC family protein [Acidobacteria bacterium 13_1_20CM_2_55_15]PYS15759.1 MAG: YicC family protein [Acidobacteriota bacterium]
MIYSMTGFGSGRAEAPNLSVLVEIKSVNHRYLDIHIKIPGEYQNFENVIRQKISTAFKRGRLDAFVRIEYKRENIKLDVNEQLIRAYVNMLSELKAAYPIQGEVTLDMLTRLPGLIGVPATDLSAEENDLIAQTIREATSTALAQLKQMRIAEGQSLIKDIDRRLSSIHRHLETILAHSKDFIEHYRRQLIARVSELAPQLVADSGHRLETEALLYAERSDIAEETTRLRSHLDQFAGLKNLEDEAGKRMDFILQEMNREVTTILSKTSGLNELGANIGQAAIEIKVEIEKLREQVQNLE